MASMALVVDKMRRGRVFRSGHKGSLKKTFTLHSSLLTRQLRLLFPGLGLGDRRLAQKLEE